MSNAINFNGQTFTQDGLNEKTGPELAELHNMILENSALDHVKPVSKFATKTDGLKRVWALLEKAGVPGEGAPKAEPKSKPKPKSKPAGEGEEPKKGRNSKLQDRPLIDWSNDAALAGKMREAGIRPNTNRHRFVDALLTAHHGSGSNKVSEDRLSGAIYGDKAPEALRGALDMIARGAKEQFAKINYELKSEVTDGTKFFWLESAEG